MTNRGEVRARDDKTNPGSRQVRTSEGGQGPDQFARLPLCQANLIQALQIQPKLGRGPREMCQAQRGVAGDGAASVEGFGDAACVVPGGLRVWMDGFPPLKRWAFLFRARGTVESRSLAALVMTIQQQVLRLRRQKTPPPLRMTK